MMMWNLGVVPWLPMVLVPLLSWWLDNHPYLPYLRYTMTYNDIYIYIHTVYVYLHMHTCIHAYMHTCIHAYMHTCIHAYMHTCIHTYAHTYIYIYILYYSSTGWTKNGALEIKVALGYSCRLFCGGALEGYMDARLDSAWKTTGKITGKTRGKFPGGSLKHAGNPMFQYISEGISWY